MAQVEQDAGPQPTRAWTEANAGRFAGGEIREAVIVTVAEVARLRYKRGEIVVTVKDAGNGAMIDARYWLDATEGFVPRSVKKQARPATDRKPTREGFWLDAGMAESLIDALARAAVIAGDDDL